MAALQHHRDRNEANRAAPPSALQLWRQQIFSSVLLYVLILGGATALPSVVLAAREAMWGTVLVDVLAVAFVAFLQYCHALRFELRVGGFLVLMYLVGVWLLIKVGDPGFIYLMAFVFMGALFCHLRNALKTLVLASVTVMVAGYYFSPSIRFEMQHTDEFWRWLIIALNFSFISSLLTISCSVLLKRLERALEHQQHARISLEQGQASLRAANEELRLVEAAVARLHDLVTIMRVKPAEQGLEYLKIVFVNEAFERRTGYSGNELIGRSLDFLAGPDTQQEQIARWRDGLIRREAVHLELICYTRERQSFWLEADIVPLANEDGEFTHWVATGRDISERKRSEDHIHQLAYYDVLTGLPNRRLLMDRMQILLANARRSGTVSAVLFIDLDNFKLINDARGHAVGDTILLQVTQRLTESLRDNDTVARVGGDEFVVLLSMMSEDLIAASHVTMNVAEKIRLCMMRSFEADGLSYGLTCSIGVTLLPRGNQSANDLMREADTAMYRAKAAGRNQIAFYEESMQSDVERRLTIERELADALGHHQLQMYIQPQFAADGGISGGELLLRWNHPQKGLISPAVFIPVAEESNLIVHIGDWVLKEGCLALNRLRSEGLAQTLSVNVSPKQFRQTDFVRKVRDVLQETRANPHHLILEVTEGLLIDNLHETITRMQELAALGVRFSIDDFGTGYSSFAYLKKLPIYELKIDQSFVRDMPDNANDRAIVQSILSMASHLGLRVVAEGVETREQAEFLIANGCDSMQGYYFARPMPLERWIESRLQLQVPAGIVRFSSGSEMFPASS